MMVSGPAQAAAAARGLPFNCDFEIAEGRPHVAHEELARELDRDRGHITAHARDERHFHDFERLAFLAGGVAHGGGDGADEAVAHENTEEGADERGADLVADRGGVGAVEGRHGVHDAQHGRDDAEAGQRIGDLLHRMRGLVGRLVMRLQLHLEQALQLVRIEAAADHQAQAVRDELHQVVIGLDLRIVLEERAAVFGVEAGLDGHESVLTDLRSGCRTAVSAVARSRRGCSAALSGRRWRRRTRP